MSDSPPLLQIRFEGEAVGHASVPLLELLRFLTSLNTAIHRVGAVLDGKTNTAKRGPTSKAIETETALRLVSLTEGSRAAVLGFERTKAEPDLMGTDIGMTILFRALDGLHILQDDRVQNALPIGYDNSVLKAWEDTGAVFDRGIDSIEFTLKGSTTLRYTTFTRDTIKIIKSRISQARARNRVIEGRLMMADFKEQSTRCRIHPSIGEPKVCEFDDELKQIVLKNLLKFVRLTGEAVEDPVSGKIKRLKIQSISPLFVQETEEAGHYLIDEGSTTSFWESPSLDELARIQGVKPITDVRSLYGTWPGDDDDGFEEAITALRRNQIHQYNQK